MRSFSMVLPVSALILASCGPKPLALPAERVDQAATCAVVSAADARAKSPNVAGDLDFQARTRIIHYAMLAASEGGRFTAKQASAVVAKMGELESSITNGKWQDLVAPCDQAFPEVKKTSGIELPAVKFDAQLGCYATADFLVKSFTSADPKAQAELDKYQEMKRKLDGPIGSGLKARAAGDDYEKTQSAKQDAIAKMTKLGAPSEVMKLCVGRFG